MWGGGVGAVQKRRENPRQSPLNKEQVLFVSLKNRVNMAKFRRAFLSSPH